MRNDPHRNSSLPAPLQRMAQERKTTRTRAAGEACEGDMEMIDINELRQSLGAIQPEEAAELLDRLEAAEKERDALREGLKRMCLDEDKEAKALRAKIEQMEQQEPVAWLYEYSNPIDGSLVWRTVPGYWNAQFPKSSKPLYALPGAQAAPSVPEGFALVNKAHFLAVLDREDWRTAKNRAELRAMLAAAPEAKP